MRRLADKLELSQDQEVALIAGSELFKRLIDRVRAGRAQHLTRQQVQTSERLPTGRAVDLQRQADMADRLQVLVRKELLLQTMASGFVGSVLDVWQVAQAAVLSWPYCPHMGTFAGILGKQRAERQQQQRQQPPLPPPPPPRHHQQQSEAPKTQKLVQPVPRQQREQPPALLPLPLQLPPQQQQEHKQPRQTTTCGRRAQSGSSSN
jgi:hypothetical protein